MTYLSSYRGWRLFLSIVIGTLAISTSAGIGTTSLAWQETPGPWLAEERDVLPAIDGDPFLLSSDGLSVAGINPAGALCVWSIDDGDESCDPSGTVVTRTDRMIDWSPDGSALAYANAAEDGYDRDIYVFEIEAGTSINVTDDGVTDMDAAGAAVAVDTFPVWTTDSQSLSFARTTHPATLAETPPPGSTETPDVRPSVEIMSISRDGSSLEPIAAIDNPFVPEFVDAPMQRLEDDSLVLAPGDSSDPASSEAQDDKSFLIVTPDGTVHTFPLDHEDAHRPYLLDATMYSSTPDVTPGVLTVELPAIGSDASAFSGRLSTSGRTRSSNLYPISLHDTFDPFTGTAIGMAFLPGTTNFLIIDFRPSEIALGVYAYDHTQALTIPIGFDGPYWSVDVTISDDHLAMIAIPGEDPILVQFFR